MLKLRLVLTILLLNISYSGFSQTKEILLPRHKGNIFAQKTFDGYWYFFTGQNNSFSTRLMRMNLSTNAVETLDTMLPYCQSISFNDSGAFFVTFEYLPDGNDGEHRLNYYRFGEKRHDLGVINQYTSINRKRPLAVLENGPVYCVSGYMNGTNGVWISDGTTSGTKRILNSPIEISDIFMYKSSPYFVARHMGMFCLMDSQAKPVSGYYNNLTFRKLHETQNSLLFYLNKRLCSTNDFTTIDSSGFAFIENSLLAPNYSNDSIVEGLTQVGAGMQSYRLRIVQPYSLELIPPSKRLSKYGYRFENQAGPYIFSWSFDYGYEVLKHYRNDSVDLVKDLQKGMKSSIYPQSPRTLQSEKLYFAGTNGGNNGLYLYETDGNNMQSHFPLKTIDQNSIIRIEGGTAYWTYYNYEDTLRIFYRDLFEKDTQPAPQKPVITPGKETEWHRSYAPANTTYAYIDLNQDYILSKKVFTDKQGNIFACGISRRSDRSYMMRHTDTGYIDSMRGCILVVKYDRNGNMLWSKTFGGFSDMAYSEPVFALDKNGDPVISGIYFMNAGFGQFQLSTSRAGMFIARMNRATGDFRWVKEITTTHWTNDILVEQSTCDKYGNTYINILYGNIQRFGQFTLNSGNLSAANALLKLDSNGNIRWAKNMATKSFKYKSTTRSSIYDEKHDILYCLQSVGFYNWQSTCKYTPFQSWIRKFNLEGEEIQSAELGGDDLNSAVCAGLTDNYAVFVSGFYRGKFNSGQVNIESPFDTRTGCNRFEDFSALINTANMRTKTLLHGQAYIFYPLDMAGDDEFMYVLGSEKISKDAPSNLCLRKYTHLGKLVAKRYFGLYAGGTFDFNFYYRVAVSKESLVLLMSSLNKMPEFSNYFHETTGLSVYNVPKDKDWIMVQEYTTEQKKLNLVIAPNPAHDFLNIEFPDEKVKFSGFDIVDQLGRHIRTVTLTGDKYQAIDLRELSSGLYFLIFRGEENYTFKLIVD